jgi:hypothetical protein
MWDWVKKTPPQKPAPPKDLEVEHQSREDRDTDPAPKPGDPDFPPIPPPPKVPDIPKPPPGGFPKPPHGLEAEHIVHDRDDLACFQSDEPPPTDRPGAPPGPPTERRPNLPPPTDRPGAPPGPPTERSPTFPFPGFPGGLDLPEVPGLGRPLEADPGVIDAGVKALDGVLKGIEVNLPSLPEGGIGRPLEADPKLMDVFKGESSEG